MTVNPFVDVIGSDERVADDANGDRVREVFEQRIIAERQRSPTSLWSKVVQVEVEIDVSPDLFGLRRASRRQRTLRTQRDRRADRQAGSSSPAAVDAARSRLDKGCTSARERR